MRKAQILGAAVLALAACKRPDSLPRTPAPPGAPPVATDQPAVTPPPAAGR